VLRDAPTMIFIPDAITPHVGLSRMWVELARSWAAAGLRVVRYDGSGNGDSDVRPGDQINTVAALAHFDDVREVTAAVSADDPSNVVLIGTCLGAYQCAEAAIELTPRGICIMNPAFVVLPSEQPASRRRQARQMPRRWLTKPLARPVGAVARRLSPNLKYQTGFDWDLWFEACMWQPAVLRRTSKVPELVWRIVNRVALNQLPADVMRRIVDRGSDVLVVCGDPDFDLFRLGARRTVSRLEQRANFTLTYLPTLDHSVMKSGQRDRVMAVLTEHVMDRFGRSPAAAVTAVAHASDDGNPALILIHGQ
jgi:pimeloyl-ACP methyl ester carboxylesterase